MIRGGKLSSVEFSALSFDDKLTHLRTLPATRRLELIIDDPEGRRLTRGFSPQEYYLMVKEIGESDAAQLLVNGSAEQIAFALDFDLWAKWEFNNEKAITWFEHLLSAGEADAMEILSRLDPELLQLVLHEEIEVGGGGSDGLATDSERLGEWDHTFDSNYYITFLNDKHARLIGTLLDIIFRNDHKLYLDLMEGLRASIKSEIEDFCYQFRCGRLADLGFPSYEQAVEIYSPLSQDSFAAGDEKIQIENEEGIVVIAGMPADDESFLSRVLSRVMTESLRQELGGLLNSAMVAESGGGIEEEAARAAHKRVYGWLNLALEHLSGSDETVASTLIMKQPLKRLFQLAFGMLHDISLKARRLNSDVYATGKALRGFRAQRPLFYRGLDPDHVDGYREFGSMTDVRTAREFLDMLQ